MLFKYLIYNIFFVTNISLKESFQLKALKISHVEKKTMICFYVV